MQNTQRTLRNDNSTSFATAENGPSNPKEWSQQPERTLSGLLVDLSGMFGECISRFALLLGRHGQSEGSFLLLDFP